MSNNSLAMNIGGGVNLSDAMYSVVEIVNFWMVSDVVISQWSVSWVWPLMLPLKSCLCGCQPRLLALQFIEEREIKREYSALMRQSHHPPHVRHILIPIAESIIPSGSTYLAPSAALLSFDPMIIVLLYNIIYLIRRSAKRLEMIEIETVFDTWQGDKIFIFQQ